MTKQRAKEIIRAAVPLSLRKQLSIFINRQHWLDPDRKYWWTMELLRDFASNELDEFHRFLWTHHLAYAVSYEVDNRFGKENMKESRKMFFSDLEKHLTGLGINSRSDVLSVLEVGCSLGYQLSYLEANLFTGAVELDGIDIDRQAIAQGVEYLRRSGSKVRLYCDDMENLSPVLKDKMYDIVICTGVLMYLKQDKAVSVVKEMLRHSRIMTALSGPAHPSIDNGQLTGSVLRERDGALIHNLDAMIRDTGGRVVARRWEGDRVVDGNTVYFVFAGNGR